MKHSVIFKILPAIILFVLAFNFIHSEIIDQYGDEGECHETHDYCKLVEAASIKSSSGNNIIKECFIILDFICQNCLKQIENSNSVYEKHQNFCFYHLVQPPTYLFNKTLLI